MILKAANFFTYVMKMAASSDLPPAGANRLADLLGRKLRKTIRSRKLEVETAAKQMGLESRQLFYAVTGRAVPNEAVSRRILDWMRGVDNSKAGPPKIEEVRDTTGWQLVKTKLPFELVSRLRTESKRQGMSIASFVHLAVERLLDNRPFLATLSEAKREIDKQRQLQALRDAPSLRGILEFDVKLAKKHDELVQPERQKPIEEILQYGEEDEKWWQEV